MYIPHMNSPEKVAAVISSLEKKVDELRKTLSEFGACVSLAPLRNLETVEYYCEAAERLDIYQYLLATLVSRPYDQTLVVLRAQAATEALRGARFPARSTSVVKSLMAQQRTAIWAEIYSPLDTTLGSI